MKYIALACLLITTPTWADTQHAVYGVGAEKCQLAVSHDWVTQGEVAWVSGFMTSSSIASEKKDIFPHHTTQELVGLVFKQCKDSPFSTLNDATEVIMWVLWDAQQPKTKGEKF